MDARQTAEVWARLIGGGSLTGLNLPMNGGRMDLRGLVAPGPAMLRRYVAASAEVTELGELIVIRGAQWRGLDFSGAHLGSLRFFDSTIEDCSFEGVRCQDWRMWGTTIINTSFQSADLRKAALGGVENGRRNSFRQIDLTKADLRQTVFVSCDIIDCRFIDTKLSKVDFQGTVFVNCIFEGELDEVLFYRQAFRGETFPANQMKGVDLRRAKLRHVEFRGLDMSEVQWPEDDDHVVVENYTATLDRALDLLKGHGDVASKKLGVVLGMKRKWAGPSQKRGVLSKRDLVEGRREVVASSRRRQTVPDPGTGKRRPHGRGAALPCARPSDFVARCPSGTSCGRSSRTRIHGGWKRQAEFLPLHPGYGPIDRPTTSTFLLARTSAADAAAST